MRAYTPDLPPDAWIIEELEKLRRPVPLEGDRPGLRVPAPPGGVPEGPRPSPPPGSEPVVIDL
jgi:hypothetical protein